MKRLESRDEKGVAVYMRVENLFTHIDPIGLGEYVDYPFEQKVFNCITTESQFKVVMCDGPLFDGSVYSDFYGFDTSNDNIIDDPVYRKWIERANNSNGTMRAILQSTIISTPVVLAGDEIPFYRNSYKVYDIPSKWRLRDKEVHGERLLPISDTYTVWNNGGKTDKDTYDKRIAGYRLEDISTDWRKK